MAHCKVGEKAEALDYPSHEWLTHQKSSDPELGASMIEAELMIK